jgi:hypothetical protein
VRRLIKTTPLVLALLTTGCSVSYCLPNTFARDFPLYSGEIRGTAVTETGDASAFAHVRVQGANMSRRADSAGNFRVWDLDEGPWVLRIDEDGDGDGVPERQRVITTVLRRTNVQRTLLNTSENVELTGVDVGEVVLEGTATVRGHVYLSPTAGAPGVPPTQLGRNALVIAGRNLDLPRISGGGSDLVSLGAERKTGVDSTGAFELRNVVGGPVFLLVLVYEGAVGDPANLVQVSEPVFVRADGGTEAEPIVLDTPIVLPPPQASPPQTTLQVMISPAPPERSQAFLTLVPPGMELPTECELDPAPAWFTTFPHARRTQAVNALPITTFTDTPTGVWDIQVCVVDAEGISGLLTEQTVIEPVADQPPPLFGPVLLTETNPCLSQPRCEETTDCAEGFFCYGDLCESDDDCGGEVDSCTETEVGMRCDNEGTPRRCLTPPSSTPWTDCDGDGRRGLASHLAFPEELPTWQGCAEQCEASGAVGDATCEVEGQVYDCDDDGDGQADVTEGIACYGLGKGTDSDSDAICDGIDPFPDCKANTAEACVAGTDDGPEVQPDLLVADYTVVEPPANDWCELQGADLYVDYKATCYLDPTFGTYGPALCLVDNVGVVGDAGELEAPCYGVGTCDVANSPDGVVAACIYDAGDACANTPCGTGFTCDDGGGTPQCIGDIADGYLLACYCEGSGVDETQYVDVASGFQPAGSTCGASGPDAQTSAIWDACLPSFDSWRATDTPADGGSGSVGGCDPTTTTPSCGLGGDEITVCQDLGGGQGSVQTFSCSALLEDRNGTYACNPSASCADTGGNCQDDFGATCVTTLTSGQECHFGFPPSPPAQGRWTVECGVTEVCVATDDGAGTVTETCELIQTIGDCNAGDTGLRCEGNGNLSFCRGPMQTGLSLDGDEVRLQPVGINCESFPGGPTGADPGVCNGADLVCDVGLGAPCDIGGVLNLPMRCDPLAGLVCSQPDPTVLGTCQTGGAMMDAGSAPIMDAGAGFDAGIDAGP